PQFCMSLEMVGRDRDGGYAEFVAVPARNLVPLPDGVSFPHGAVMMCSSATSLHALRKARLQAGESVAVFGTGGLGMSAIQLAGAFGAEPIFAADIDPVKLAAAERLGAIPVNTAGGDPVGMIRSATGGRGVDVAVELTGLPAVTRQAIDSAAILGRVALTGISNRGVEVYPYRELIGKELELIGVSDHHLSELTELVGLAEKGTLDLSDVVTRTIPLDGEAVNLALTLLDRFEAGIRTVILPREGR
ncbi:MAG: zinc-binding dehydrogenase, partial [Gemmatimonadota bacterium]